MKICNLINEALAPEAKLETVGQITEALESIFSSYSIPVVLQEVVINSNVITIDISITEDNETEEFELSFFILDGVPYAMVSDEDEEEDYVFSLDGIASKHKSDDGEVVNLVDPSWLEESVFIDILTSDLESELEEATQFVIRGGKKVKKKLVRNKRRKILTPKQRAGIKKAVRSRKSKKGQTARKRKISNKLRKRMKLKKNTNKRLKVAGTSSRKR